MIMIWEYSDISGNKEKSEFESYLSIIIVIDFW